MPNFLTSILTVHEHTAHILTAEVFILRVGMEMFTIAWPAIVYGLAASVAYGFIYRVNTLFYGNL